MDLMITKKQQHPISEDLIFLQIQQKKMAIFHQEQDNSSFLDELYCDEEQIWDNIEQEEEEEEEETENNVDLNPLMILEQDLEWEEEEEELKTMFIKEKELIIKEVSLESSRMVEERKESVEWMLKVNHLYGFSSLTSILSVHYFDRCISSIPFLNQSYKPWSFQLAAVTCLSLAAKVEETHLPLLLHLQVEGARPVFEPRDVQKMELLVLSTLEWRMHPMTPLSFIYHIVRRLGLKNHLHWDFLKRCELLLLSLLPDWRFMRYVPSVLATATMMHVIDQFQLDYHNHLLNVLHITKDEVNECYELIKERSSSSRPDSKRKFDQMSTMDNNSNNTTIPSSPIGVIDAYAFSSDSSNDSWGVTSTVSNNNINQLSVSASSSVSSSPVINTKKGRVREQPMTLQLPSLSRVFVDLVESPR